MRSRIQHSWLHLFVAACAACSVGVVACSDSDPETDIDPLQSAGGNAGSASSAAGAAGSAGSGGAATGGQGGSSSGAAAGSGGAAAGSSAGGSANAGGGAAGAAGAAGSGPDVGGEPDAGGDPDDGEEPEEGEFTAAFQVLRNNCVPCHANGGGLPQFAQVDEDLAFAVTQGNGAGGEPVYDRIIARAVTARTMPPSCDAGALGTGTCLTTDEAEELEDWVADGALR